MLSSLVPTYKGKGDPLNALSQGIKLLEHAFNLYKKILDKRLRELWRLAKCSMVLCLGEQLM